MAEFLSDIEERAAEERRARAEGREPDYSEENLALYRVESHDSNVSNDPTPVTSQAEGQSDTSFFPTDTVNDGSEEQIVVEINDDATVTDSVGGESNPEPEGDDEA